MGKKPSHIVTQVTRDTVKVMVAGGIIYDDIAAVLGISRSTLKIRYKTELKVGLAMANTLVVACLHRYATGQHKLATANSTVSAAKWWTQARMGWSEKHEFSGPGGAPLNPAGPTFVVRLPTPVESVKQWMDTYVPETEREPSP